MKKKLLFYPLLLLLTVNAFAQKAMIKGQVEDDQGQPLPYVNIAIFGKSKGVTSNNSGNYEIMASPKDSLVFSYAGFVTKYVLVGNRTNINISFTQSNNEIEEVVVVGFGKQKNQSVVGAISQVKGEMVQARLSGSDLSNSLTGLAPGVVTLRSSGVPGGSSSTNDQTAILVRGSSSWNSTGALTLVDGIPRDIQDVEPNDIENISILKDASATAVFGVKGANGVILVTTKKGNIGKATLTFDASTSASTISRVYKALDAYDALSVRNYAIINSLPSVESDWAKYTPNEILDYYKNQKYPDVFPNTNWQKEGLRDYTISNKYTFNISGGTKFVKYFGSLGTIYENDIFKTKDYGQGYEPNFDFSRYNFRTNLDFQITPSTTFSVAIGGYLSNQKQTGGDNNIYYKILYGMPADLFPVRYSDGTWANNLGVPRFQNPIFHLNAFGTETESKTELNNTFILKQDFSSFAKGLSFTGTVAYDTRILSKKRKQITDATRVTKYIRSEELIGNILGNSSEQDINELAEKFTDYAIPGNAVGGINTGFDYVTTPYTVSGEDFLGGTPSVLQNLYKYLYLQTQVNYDRTFNNKHSLGLLGLFFTTETNDGLKQTEKAPNFVARATYDFKKTYLFEFNAAYNGTSLYGPAKRFGFFPSYSFGWNLSQEKFIKDNIKSINNLKLKYSNGYTGSNDGAPINAFLDVWSRESQFGYFGINAENSPYAIYLFNRPGNPQISWETSHQINYGLELSLFKNLLELKADYFTETRKGIVEKNATLPEFFGAKTPALNNAATEKKGYDLELKINKRFGRLNTYFTSNYSNAVDKVVFRYDPELAPDYQKKAGYPIGQHTTQVNQSSGVVTTYDAGTNTIKGTNNTSNIVGEFRQVDFNSDGLIDDKDKIPFGYAERPQNSYSFTFGMDWKGFDLMAQFYGQNNITSGFEYGEFFEGQSVAFPHHLYDAYIPERGQTTSATHPAPKFSNSIQSSKGNYWSQDRSYLKLQNASIGYTLPKKIISKLGASNIKLSLNGNNLFQWSKMLEDRDVVGKDPAKTYPLMKRYTLNLKIVL